jgi:2-aminoadipate transaminase
MLKKTKPTLLYTIPVYHNPGGQTMSMTRRKRLIELSEKHVFMIIADEVYQMLNYYNKPPAAFGTMLDSQTVLSLGSFSKILAPGMRLGWIQTSPILIEKLTEAGFINSGGCVNQFTANIVRCTMDLGLLETHLVTIRDVYRSRLEVMDAALSEAFGNNMTWESPEGGYFFWLKLDESVDTSKLRQRAAEHQTGFQAGERFSSNGKLQNYLRLSFASYNEPEIRKGITRLKAALAL